MVGRGIKGQVASYKPSTKEKEEHEKSHIPFRRWCEFCVMGESKNASHKSSDKEEKNQVPTISYDYAVPKSKEGKEEDIKMWPILMGVNHESNWITANMVPRKGPDPFAVHVVVKEIEASGYNKMIVKSDQEPAILDLLRTARRERAETIQVIPEESPVGEHQSNGKIENTVQIVEGQIRIMKLVMEKRMASIC